MICNYLDQNVHVVFKDHFIEILCNGNGDWTFVIGWYFLCFQIWLRFAAFQVFQEFFKIWNAELNLTEKEFFRLNATDVMNAREKLTRIHLS